MSRDFYSRANSQDPDFQDMPSAPSDYYRRTMTNPFLKTHKIPESEYVEITKENRFQYFTKNCPICGKRIFGRPSEYPYYKTDGNRVAFLCGFCVHLKCAKDEQIHRTMEDILADEFDD